MDKISGRNTDFRFVGVRDRNESKKSDSTRLDSVFALLDSARLDTYFKKTLLDSTRLDSTQNRNDRRYNFLQTVRISDKINIVQKNTS